MTIHENEIVHGVSVLESGIRYGLFLLKKWCCILRLWWLFWWKLRINGNISNLQMAAKDNYWMHTYLFIILLFMLIIIASIGICDSFWVVRSIEYGRECHNFFVGMVLLEKSCSPFSVWELNQKLKNTVRASISCFIILSETGIVLMIFHID